MTKGQKNELARQQIQQRKDAIRKHGFTIKSRTSGYGEFDVSLWKDGERLNPALSYSYDIEVLEIAEKMIESNTN